MATNEGAVTVVLLRTIKPGREADYQQWAADTAEVMGRFPGFLGAALNQPTALNPRWVFMPRWASTEHLLAWDASPELQERIAELVPLVEGDTDRQRHHGLDFWFPLPSPEAKRPSPWKMILVTLVVLWPTILALTALLGLVPGLNLLPWWLAPLPMLVLLVPLLEFVVMPAATKLFAPFLYGRS